VPDHAGVSVVIPTYNRAAQVVGAVASALAQRWEPLEVIVVDDASTDDTVERLLAMSDSDPRLRVVTRDRNGGESVARNQGILVSRLPYVAFLDSDNRFMPAKLERQMPDLLSGPAGSVGFTGYIESSEDQERAVILDDWFSDPETVIDALLAACAVNTSTFVAPRETLLRGGLFRADLPCCADHDLWLRLAASGCAFLYEPAPLTVYRVHPGGVSADGALVARYEELVVGDFLARPDLPPQVSRRSGYWRARWALTGAERRLAAGMPAAALRSLCRAVAACPSAVRPGWAVIALVSLQRLVSQAFTAGLRSRGAVANGADE